MPEYTRDTATYCALNKCFGYKPAKAKAMLEEGVSPESLLPGQAMSEGIIGWAEDEISDCIGKGIAIVTAKDKEYPPLLSECPDAPLALYIKGTLPSNRNALSIVGTRKPDGYGLEMCDRIVDALHRTGSPPAIVSGLAYGIDAQAHKRTLLRQGITVAVMGTGLDSVYPGRHAWLADRIAEHGGCLISDFPLGQAPLAVNFLRRNRIIAGISGCTVVVQSPKKGGSMVTATQAFSYGRDLYAVPGRIGDGLNDGCNYLISSQMAGCICDPEVFAGYFREDGSAPLKPPTDIFGDDDKGGILHTLSSKGPMDSESLQDATRLPMKRFAALLAELEIEGKIHMEDGFHWSIKIN